MEVRNIEIEMKGVWTRATRERKGVKELVIVS